ncbi:hypothetical protein KL86PLE_100359 [uncultured Pleomorphomonas sp.]|uniref:Uncharacterized protein n=1 Tax=uncultured Pleomorphomonas sp. TaxID=442121 RepID=A0A212L2T5_9HYPH|nr:hypothetical protein KL86PLE_100359 [uncultured Pleomorphomonas sp.]
MAATVAEWPRLRPHPGRPAPQPDPSESGGELRVHQAHDRLITHWEMTFNVIIHDVTSQFESNNPCCKKATINV